MVTPKINNRISFGLLMFASFIALFAFIMAALASAGLTTFGWLSFAGALAWLPAVSFLGLPGSILASVLFGVFVVLSILTIAAILYSITNFLLIDLAFKKNDRMLGTENDPAPESVRGQLNAKTEELLIAKRDLNTANGNVTRITREIEEKTTQLNTTTQELERVNGVLNTANENVTRITRESEEKTTQLNTTTQELERVNGVLNTANENVTRITRESEEKTTQLNTTTQELERVNGELNTANATVLRITGELEKTKKRLGDENAPDSALGNVKTLTERLEALTLKQSGISPQGKANHVTTTTNKKKNDAPSPQVNPKFFRIKSAHTKKTVDVMKDGTPPPDLETPKKKHP